MYAVRFVDDEAMPAGHDFVMIDMGDDGMAVVLRASAVCPQLLEEAWAAFRALADCERDAPPQFRLRSAS